MANFLLSNALKGATNLSSLVDKVSQIKDEFEKQMDSAVGEKELEDVLVAPIAPPVDPMQIGKDGEANALLLDEEEHAPSKQVLANKEEEEEATPVTTTAANTMEATNEVAEEEGGSEDIAAMRRERNQALEALKRREAQLEKTTRKLAEQEDALQSLREQMEAQCTDKRIKLAEAKAEGLLKEGLVLAEKEGKAQALVRKMRGERDEAMKREKALQETLKRESEARAQLESELQTLRDARKRDELDKAHLSESTSETRKRVEELRHQLAQSERRELENKIEADKVVLELTEQKKLVFSLSQQLSAAKREAEHSKFQLKEQLDTRNLHGSRVDLMERSLAEAKQASEEQWKEAMQVELGLRAQLARANDQLALFERKAEEAAQRALELTAPLLRQIDLLNEQRAKTEEATSALLTRAVTSEAAEAEAISAKRKAELARGELTLRISELETALSSVQMDCSRAASDAKLANKRALEAERERDALQRQIDQLRVTMDGKVADYRTTEMQLRQTLALENEKMERAKRTWEEKMRELEERAAAATTAAAAAAAAGATATTTPAAAPYLVNPSPKAASVISSSTTTAAAATQYKHNTQEEILGSVLFGDDFSSNSIAVDFTDSSSKFLLQASELQAGVRRRDIRIATLAEQLELAQRHREELARELTELRERAQQYEANANAARDLAVMRNQNALLCELLGEREEQIEGLTADVQELKQKFREQFQLM